MLQNYSKIRWLALLLIAFSITACKKCSDDNVGTPCDGVPLGFKADMEFGQSVSTASNLNPFFLPFDTLLIDEGTSVVFRAKGDYDSVKWRVGEDPRTFIAEQFSLSFNRQPYRVPIEMVGYRKAASFGGCVTAQKVDTVRRVFTKLGYDTHSSPLIGIYLGAMEDTPTDTFRVQIRDTIVDPRVPIKYYLRNFPKGCSIDVFGRFTNIIDIHTAYRSFGFGRWHTYRTGDGENCSDVNTNLSNGIGRLDYDNKTLVMEYVEKNFATNITRNRRFIGKRVN